MVSLIKKKKKGNWYYYLAKSKRIDGNPRIVWQIYLGSETRLEKMAMGEYKEELKLKSFSFGIIAAILSINEELRFTEIVDKNTNKKDIKGLTVGGYLLIQILGRVHNKLSRRAISKWLPKSNLSKLMNRTLGTTPQTLLNQLEYLDDATIEKIEDDLIKRLMELGITPSVFFWDTTNFFTYIDNETTTLSQKGHSKEGRHDKNLIGVGIGVNPDGIPLFHQSYEGNIHDSKIFKMVLSDIRSRLANLEIPTEKLTIVFDKGNNSKGNIKDLIGSKIHFVGSLKPDQVKDMMRIPLNDYKFCYKTGKDNKVISIRRRKKLYGKVFDVVVSYNPKTYSRQLKTFERKMKDTLDALDELKAKLSKPRGRGRKPTVQGTYKRVFKLIPEDLQALFSIEIDDDCQLSYKIVDQKREEKLSSFGKQAVFTDHSKWSDKEILLAYNGKSNVEDDFKWLKDKVLLPVKPFFIRKDERLKAHVFLMVIALMFYRYMFWKLKDLPFSPYEIIELLSGIRVTVLRKKAGGSGRLMIETMDKDEARIFSRLDLARFIPD